MRTCSVFSRLRAFLRRDARCVCFKYDIAYVPAVRSSSNFRLGVAHARRISGKYWCFLVTFDIESSVELCSACISTIYRGWCWRSVCLGNSSCFPYTHRTCGGLRSRTLHTIRIQTCARVFFLYMRARGERSCAGQDREMPVHWSSHRNSDRSGGHVQPTIFRATVYEKTGFGRESPDFMFHFVIKNCYFFYFSIHCMWILSYPRPGVLFSAATVLGPCWLPHTACDHLRLHPRTREGVSTSHTRVQQQTVPRIGENETWDTALYSACAQ